MKPLGSAAAMMTSCLRNSGRQVRTCVARQHRLAPRTPQQPQTSYISGRPRLPACIGDNITGRVRGSPQGAVWWPRSRVGRMIPFQGLVHLEEP